MRSARCASRVRRSGGSHSGCSAAVGAPLVRLALKRRHRVVEVTAVVHIVRAAAFAPRVVDVELSGCYGAWPNSKMVVCNMRS